MAEKLNLNPGCLGNAGQDGRIQILFSRQVDPTTKRGAVADGECCRDQRFQQKNELQRYQFRRRRSVKQHARGVAIVATEI